jgi:HAD superfamily hydrolase (TIGR01549 family)
MTSPIKVVFFDLDETLFDHVYSTQCAIREVHQNFPNFALHPLDQFEQDLAPHLHVLWPSVLDGTLTLEARIAEALRRLGNEYGVVPETTDHISAAKCYRETYLRMRQPIEGAQQLMEILRPHVKIGIITNHHLEEQRNKLIACKLEVLTDFIVCSGDVGVPKPDERIFRVALEQAGCAPDVAVLVGDSWDADVIGAAAVGIRAVWLNRARKPCPDPALATEINALTPADVVANVLLGKG